MKKKFTREIEEQIRREVERDRQTEVERGGGGAGI